MGLCSFDQNIELEEDGKREKGDGERWVLLEEAIVEGEVVDEAIDVGD